MAETGAKSWRTTVAGAITATGTISGLIVQLGFADTPWGSKVVAVCGAIALLGASWGLTKAKDSTIHGAGQDAIDVAK